MSDRKAHFGIDPSSTLETPVQAFRALLLLTQRLRNLMDARLRPDGLTTQQAALLTAARALGRPSLNEAAAALETTPQNVAQLVEALERKGFLAVESDPSDKRRRLLATTMTSERYWRTRDESDREALSAWFAVLTPDELETLCSLAIRLIDHLTPLEPK